MSNQYSGDLKAAILEAVKRPDGMATADLKGYKVPQIGRMVQKLQYAGLVVRAPMPGKFGRYFDTLPRAEEYANRMMSKPAPVVNIKSSPWPADAPVVIPANVKRTKHKTPPPRFAPDPKDKSWRLFSSMKPGQYLEAA